MTLQRGFRIAPFMRLVRCNGLNLTQFLILSHRMAHFNSIPTLSCRGVRRYAIRSETATTTLNLSINDSKLLALINNPVVKPYPAGVVEDAILSVFSKQIPELEIESYKLYYTFVKTNYESLSYLNDFICNISPGESSGLALLTSVELTNTLFLFKDLLKKNKIPNLGYVHPQIYHMESMVEEFLILLLNRRAVQASIPHVVGSILKSKRAIDDYQNLFAAGVGKFLPEISVLQKQFDFSKLGSFEPVSEGIDWLKKEFTEYSKKREEPHDPSFYETLIPVMRYSHLLASLRSLNTGSVKPESIIPFSRDSKAPEIQTALQELSGESLNYDNMIFGNQRNFFNALFCTTGLGNFDKMFSYLLQCEKSGSSFTKFEKSEITNFLDTFLPLVASGIVTSEQLADIKYGCLVARFNDNVLKPFKVNDSMFDNYEFSLLVLVDLADFAYIIRPVREILGKPFVECSLSEIEGAVSTFSSEHKPVIQKDAQTLMSALEVYAAYSLRGFAYFDRVIADDRVMNAIEKQEEKHLHITELSPKIVEIFLESPTKSTSSSPSVFNEFIDVLSAIRKEDTGIDFSEFSSKTISRILIDKINFIKEGVKVDIADSRNLERLKKLNEVLIKSIAEGWCNTSELDVIILRGNVCLDKDKAIYVQVPEELSIHKFVKELVIIRDHILHGDFQNFTSYEVIESLRKSIEAESIVAYEADKDLVTRLGVLANKLCRLFMINGNDTEVLDAIIRSHNVFEALEAKIQEKNLNSERSNIEDGPKELEYFQVPDNFHLHTYANELALVHTYLKRPFKDCTPDQVLDALNALSLETPNTEAALVFQKLYWNLLSLFRYNNDHTSVLDAIITNQSVFSQFEKSLEREKEEISTQKCHTVASYQKEIAARREEMINSGPGVKIVASNDDAKSGHESDSLKKTKAVSVSIEDASGNSSTEFLLKDDLEHILRKANKERKIEEEERFREREAYIWSTSMLKSLGTLETKQFFTLPEKNYFPMFPGVDNDAEYLVLTPNRRTILAKINPLGATHIPEDMLSILERLSELEIVKYSPSLAKLQKRGWNLIGSGKNNLMLVFSRSPRTYKFSFVKTAKLLLSTAGFVFITLFGLNYFLDDPNERKALEVNGGNATRVNYDEVLSSVDRSNDVASQRSTWSSLFWK